VKVWHVCRDAPTRGGPGWSRSKSRTGRPTPSARRGRTETAARWQTLGVHVARFLREPLAPLPEVALHKGGAEGGVGADGVEATGSHGMGSHGADAEAD